MFTENDMLKVYGELCKRESTLISIEDRLWLVLFEFAVAMTEGDLNDYVFNETGSHVLELKRALTTLKAYDVLEIIDEVVVLFDGSIASDILERQSCIAMLDQEKIEALDDLTEDYYDLEESYWQTLMTAYKKR